MAKILVAFVALAGAISADAGKASCALNGARAVDDLLDSAVYIMASIVRCDKSSYTPNDQGIRCALDVSSSIESVNAMVNVIVKAVDKCGKLKTENRKCGLAVGVLTEGWAGLSAASAGIVAKCPNNLNGHTSLETVGQAMANAGASTGAINNNLHGNQLISPLSGNMQNLQGGQSFGQCIVNVKGSMKSLFKTIKRIMTVKHNCKDPASKKCAHNDLKIMAGLIGMGEFLSGAIGKCTPLPDATTDPTGNADALALKRRAVCAQYSMKLIHQLGVVDRAAVQMSKDCELTPDQRLYLEQEDSNGEEKKDENAVTFGLMALLPFTAIVSFVVGKRFAKARSVQTFVDIEENNVE